MSTATEKAKEEADRIEREEAEEAARRAADDGGPIDLDQVEGPSDQQVEAMSGENSRHMRALETIMGPALGLFEPCPHCDGVGIKERGPEPVQYDRYRQCPTCRGFGQVLTGAQAVQGAMPTVACPHCGGRGYQERIGQAADAAAPAPQQAEPQESWGVPTWMGDPSIHPSPPTPIPTS